MVVALIVSSFVLSNLEKWTQMDYRSTRWNQHFTNNLRTAICWVNPETHFSTPKSVWRLRFWAPESSSPDSFSRLHQCAHHQACISTLKSCCWILPGRLSKWMFHCKWSCPPLVQWSRYHSTTTNHWKPRREVRTCCLEYRWWCHIDLESWSDHSWPASNHHCCRYPRNPPFPSQRCHCQRGRCEDRLSFRISKNGMKSAKSGTPALYPPTRVGVTRKYLMQDPNGVDGS